jgi:photosystem II stability/assembly factor-like uncharacterized protein
MKKSRLLILNIGLFLSLCAPAAWPASWRSIGPDGGAVYALAFAPSDAHVAYAGTPGGVFRSSDGGSSWTAVNNGLGSLTVLSVAVDPRDPGVAYAGTYGGLYKTTSGGASWRQLPLGTFPSITGVQNLTIDPAHPRILYASIADASDRFGLFRSADGGAHWTERDAGLPGGVFTLGLDPDHAGTLYASVPNQSSTPGTTVYKTTNGGGSWAVLPGLTTRQASSFAFLRSTGTVYASTLDGLFATRDGGATWNLVSLGAPYLIAVTPSGKLYGSGGPSRVVSSLDGGRTWSDPVPSSPLHPYEQVSALALDSAGDHLLAAGLGVFSLDAAKGWIQVNRGLRATWVTGLAVSSASPSLLFTSSVYGGLFVSTNGGEDFISRNAGLAFPFNTNVPIYAFASSPSAPGTLIAGLSFGEVAQTSNVGRRWASETLLCQNLPVDTVAMVPPATFFAASTQVFLGSSCPGSCTAKVSRDGGASFSCLDGPRDVSAFLVDPLLPAVVYAAGGDTLWKSTDQGGHFTQVAANLGMVTALASSPAAHETLYSGGYGSVLKSTDGGLTWVSAHQGLPSGPAVLAVDPSNPSLVYAGCDRGVFESLDAGATWSPLGDGFPLTVPSAIALDSGRHVLYVGTQSVGTWALNLP